jgi:hypothetical protein
MENKIVSFLAGCHFSKTKTIQSQQNILYLRPKKQVENWN